MFSNKVINILFQCCDVVVWFHGRSLLETLDLAPTFERSSSALTPSSIAAGDHSAKGNADEYLDDENSEDEQERRRAGTVVSRNDFSLDEGSFDDESSSHLVPNQDNAGLPSFATRTTATTTKDSELVTHLGVLLGAATAAASVARPSPQAVALALTSSLTAPNGQLGSPRFSYNASISSSSDIGSISTAEPPAAAALEVRSNVDEKSSSHGAPSNSSTASESSVNNAAHLDTFNTPPQPPSSSLNTNAAVNSSPYPPLDLVEDGPFGDNQQSSLNFLNMPSPEPPLFQPLPPVPPQAAPAAVGTVKLVGRLLVALSGNNSVINRDGSAVTENSLSISDTTQKAVRGALKSAVENVLSLLDSSPLADSVLEVSARLNKEALFSCSFLSLLVRNNTLICFQEDN